MEITRGLVAGVAALSVAAGAGATWVATRGGEPLSADTGVIVEPVAAPAAPVAAAAPRAERPRRSERPAPVDVVREAPRPEPVVDPVFDAPAIAPIVEVAPSVPAMVEPAAPLFEEVEIAADSVLGLQIESSVSSEDAAVEDRVTARVTRDVRAGDTVAIPAGSRAEGEVTLVERGGRLKERAQLGVRFTSVVLADGTRVPLETETVYREGDRPSGESAAKIGGGAIGGAIIGGILGGAKGAIIGGSAGAGAGTAAVLAGGRNPATLPSGTPVTVRLTRPAFVTLER
ncbi:MAG: hypothetical protein AB7P99_00165 [Vicinamibacterales bacterium]